MDSSQKNSPIVPAVGVPVDENSPNAAPIRTDELLPWSDLHDRLGWGPRAIAKARSCGLRVLKFARRQYVTGAEIIRFLEAVTDEDQHDRGSGGESLFPHNRCRKT